VGRLVEAIEAQFGAAWDMLAEAVGAFGEGWRAGDSSYAVPAGLAYHVIETADYYFHDDLEAFGWAGRFGADWETEEPARLPSRRAILDYLDEVRDKTSRWIADRGDDGLLAPDEVFHEEGMSHLDRALYVLRHTQHTIGELCSLLRARDIPRPAWR
jgi:hypothetical protein